MTLITIPTSEILTDALPRDRTQLGAAALSELVTSIAANGLRQPIEIWQLSQPTADHRYGLISGLRRLTAHQRLASLRGNGDFTQITAFLRSPDSIAAAMAQMVEENEVRANTSAWEKGATLLAAVSAGIFDSIDAAALGLHPAITRQKRARLRSFAEVVEEFDGALPTPEALSHAQMLRLALALRAGFGDQIHLTLHENANASLAPLWQSLLPVLAEAALDPDLTEITASHPTRPRRSLTLRQGLTLRRERTTTGWILRFSGPEARSGGLIDDVLDKVEQWFQPK